MKNAGLTSVGKSSQLSKWFYIVFCHCCDKERVIPYHSSAKIVMIKDIEGANSFLSDRPKSPIPMPKSIGLLLSTPNDHLI